ncbi:hypothetical protein KUTeg_022615 [Tegillarca granosa]|uniref:Secreted protein n=1 Tax=Tegillarca granosa TaxID=220873 RepID=A0ABQ9E351_TEGGR|nr:hypothetical protein KUTeg_022615 [Tegillarca granosa]
MIFMFIAYGIAVCVCLCVKVGGCGQSINTFFYFSEITGQISSEHGRSMYIDQCIFYCLLHYYSQGGLGCIFAINFEIS